MTAKQLRLLSVLTCLSFCSGIGDVSGVNSDTPGYFPFFVPPLDADESFVDMSFLNPGVAGADGRIEVSGSNFVDGRGRRVRLLGTNVTFGGAFPAKEDAGLIAAHLRKLGMNVVRFHHLDMSAAPRGIWAQGKRTFDANQFDRLDWFIYQLKKHGIYTNLNLHVSRTYPGIPGDISRAFRFGKGLDNFYPDFIRLQIEYAQMLLTHRNPYTGSTYADEPAVAVVEINNENSLTNIPLPELRTMPQPYRAELRNQWNTWLRDRYTSTARLQEHWNEGVEPLGEGLLSDPDPEKNDGQWDFQQGNGARMTTRRVPDPASGDESILEITTHERGKQSWDLQFHRRGLDLTEGRTYTLSYRAAADEEVKINVNVRLDIAPWRMCGLSTSAVLKPEWQRFSHTFVCTDPERNHCRAGINLNNQLGVFRFADFSLRPGAPRCILEPDALETGSIGLAAEPATQNRKTDFSGFLSDTECDYVREMMSYLKDELGVKAPICGTQVSYGGIHGVYREGTVSDFLDMHAYWQHPRFPGKPWDRNNWKIPNTSMVASEDGGTLGNRAWYRMMGKPFTISEYDHPAPSDYAAELFPMLASFAAFQDWDGIYQFSYANRQEDWDNPVIRNYFGLCFHPGKLVFLPIAAVMFRMEAVEAGGNPFVVDVPAGDSRSGRTAGGQRFAPAESLKALALTRPVGFRLKDDTEDPDSISPELPGRTRLSNTGQILWDVTEPEKAIYTVNAPAVRAAVGFVRGEKIALGDVTIEVTRAGNGWAAVAVGALDGLPLSESSRILVVLAGRIENSDMGWNAERTSVGQNWGEAPIVAEGISATVRLPSGSSVSALDGSGKPIKELPVQRTSDGAIEFSANSRYRTLWYAVSD